MWPSMKDTGCACNSIILREGTNQVAKLSILQRGAPLRGPNAFTSHKGGVEGTKIKCTGNREKNLTILCEGLGP